MHGSFHPRTMKDAHILVQGYLGIDADQIPETAGGTIHFSLDAGTANGNRNDLLLGSIFGPVPGTGGLVLYVAYASNARWDLASNAVSMEIVP